MRKRTIIIPKTQSATVDLDYDRADSSQLIEYDLSEEEFLLLIKVGLLNGMNKVAEINLDDFEDESVLTRKKINLLIDFLEGYSNSSDFQVVQIIKNLIPLFEEALERKTGVYFYF